METQIADYIVRGHLYRDIGLVGPENGSFPLLYVVKMSLCRWVGGWFKKASKNPYVIDEP